MPQENIPDRLARLGIVPVVTIEKVEHALPVADALCQGGLPLIEVTMRTAAAPEVIRILSRARPEMLVGAGTVLSARDLEIASESGAAFAVAPGLNPDLVRQARDLDLPFVPGVATPTEIETALGLGCRLVKFFPAEALGGAAMLEALSAPYQHTGIRFVPTGGIQQANLASYLGLNTVAAVGGAWLARKDDLAGGKWQEIQTRCQAALELAGKSRGTLDH